MKHFSFDKVSDEFDEHINLSINGYSNMYSELLNLLDYFVVDNTNVVDIGSSSGRLLSDIKNKYKVNTIGIEPVESFISYDNYKNVDVVVNDAIGYEFNNCSVITSIFTMQFIPIHKRLDILKNVYNGLNYGGIFVMCEKVEMTEYFNGVFQDILVNNKRSNFKDSDILDKNISLRNIMRCISVDEHIKLLNMAGFKHIDRFWQNNRFVGFVCRKGL